MGEGDHQCVEAGAYSWGPKMSPVCTCEVSGQGTDTVERETECLAGKMGGAPFPPWPGGMFLIPLSDLNVYYAFKTMEKSK